eukprot:Em0002g1033a
MWTKSPPWTRWLPHIVYTVNCQVHESTKHTPYELVFGQPPRTVVLPDVSFRGKIDEEDLKDDTCAKEEDSRGEYSEVVEDRVVKENGNVENYCENSMEDDGTKEENHEDGGSMIDDDNADDTQSTRKRPMKMVAGM